MRVIRHTFNANAPMPFDYGVPVGETYELALRVEANGNGITFGDVDTIKINNQTPTRKDGEWNFFTLKGTTLGKQKFNVTAEAKGFNYSFSEVKEATTKLSTNTLKTQTLAPLFTDMNGKTFGPNVKIQYTGFVDSNGYLSFTKDDVVKYTIRNNVIYSGTPTTTPVDSFVFEEGMVFGCYNIKGIWLAQKTFDITITDSNTLALSGFELNVMYNDTPVYCEDKDTVTPEFSFDEDYFTVDGTTKEISLKSELELTKVTADTVEVPNDSSLVVGSGSSISIGETGTIDFDDGNGSSITLNANLLAKLIRTLPPSFENRTGHTMTAYLDYDPSSGGIAPPSVEFPDGGTLDCKIIAFNGFPTMDSYYLHDAEHQMLPIQLYIDGMSGYAWINTADYTPYKKFYISTSPDPDGD